MKINDKVYGKITIEDPIIIEIVDSKPFQRLKSINQYGNVNYIYTDRFQTTRFEHSIGVWWLLKNLDVDLEVQIAGLIHDIGHTAFSHRVDEALGKSDEDFHEENMQLIEGYDDLIDFIVEKGFNLKSVDNYPEIKQKFPYVGADRLDYCIRDYISSTNEEIGFGKEVLNSIKLQNRKIYFTDPKIAAKVSLMGLEAMWNIIYEPNVAVIYGMFQKILEKGFEEGWIRIEDTVKTDDHLWDICIKNIDRFDPVYKKVLTEKFEVTRGTEEDYDFYHEKLKLRYFDPFVEIEGKLQNLSEIDQDFKNELNEKVQKFRKAGSGVYYKLKV